MAKIWNFYMDKYKFFIHYSYVDITQRLILISGGYIYDFDYKNSKRCYCFSYNH